MGGYFKPLRRKVGVVTLVIALVFMGGWFRSKAKFEYLFVSVGNASCGVTSMHGGLDFGFLIELKPEQTLNLFDFKSVELHVDPQDPFNATPWGEGFEFEWRWDWKGFHFGEGRWATRRDLDLMVPYWSIVLPVTLLSA